MEMSYKIQFLTKPFFLSKSPVWSFNFRKGLCEWINTKKNIGLSMTLKHKKHVFWISSLCFWVAACATVFSLSPHLHSDVVIIQLFLFFLCERVDVIFIFVACDTMMNEIKEINYAILCWKFRVNFVHFKWDEMKIWFDFWGLFYSKINSFGLIRYFMTNNFTSKFHQRKTNIFRPQKHSRENHNLIFAAITFL